MSLRGRQAALFSIKNHNELDSCCIILYFKRNTLKYFFEIDVLNSQIIICNSTPYAYCIYRLDKKKIKQ